MKLVDIEYPGNKTPIYITAGAIELLFCNRSDGIHDLPHTLHMCPNPVTRPRSNIGIPPVSKLADNIMSFLVTLFPIKKREVCHLQKEKVFQLTIACLQRMFVLPV